MPVPTPDGVIEYILDQLTRRLDQTTSRLESSLSTLDATYVRREVFEQWKLTAEAEHARLNEARNAAVATTTAAMTVLEKRIGVIEESRQWLTRAVAGAFIVSGAAVVVEVLRATGHA